MRTTGNQCPVATPSELTANQPISSVSAQLLEPPALHALQPARYLAVASSCPPRSTEPSTTAEWGETAGPAKQDSTLSVCQSEPARR